MLFLRDPDGNDSVGTDVAMARAFRNNLDNTLRIGLDDFLDHVQPYDIDGKRWHVHENVNLYIDITANCLFDCGFCIAKTTDGRSGFLSPDIVLRTIKSLDSAGVKYSCQITGGEPTLHPDVLEIISMCAGKKIVINTNFPSVSLDRCHHINVSCHHYNSDIEETIFRRRRSRDELMGHSRNVISKIRLQCNIIKDYIDTFGEIMQYIAWGYHAMGVTSYAFSFLTVLPDVGLYSDEIRNYVRERPTITMQEICEEFEKRGHLTFKKYRAGVACYYEVWEYSAYERPVSIVLKYSNNEILHQVDTMPEMVPDMILHPNGVLTASWDMRKKVMLEP